jgi:hypothetical protein
VANKKSDSCYPSEFGNKYNIGNFHLLKEHYNTVKRSSSVIMDTIDMRKIINKKKLDWRTKNNQQRRSISHQKDFGGELKKRK